MGLCEDTIEERLDAIPEPIITDWDAAVDVIVALIDAHPCHDTSTVDECDQCPWDNMLRSCAFTEICAKYAGWKFLARLKGDLTSGDDVV